MVAWDRSLLPTNYYAAIRYYPLGGRGKAAAAGAQRALDALAAAIPHTPPDSVLGIHVGTFWRRFKLMRFLLPVMGRVQARSEVHPWLEQAAALPSVAATASREPQIALEYRAQQGLTWVAPLAVAAWWAWSAGVG